jgi:DNA-binding PadR family transcriptional regulator
MSRPLSSLDLALLGLLARKTASGYELRKIFQTTPLGSYSDSPGSIYPALRRLEALGLIRGRTERTGRRRRPLAITDRGRSALKDWLTTPADGAPGDVAQLDLRLAFLSEVFPRRDIWRFLLDWSASIDAQLTSLAAARRELGPNLSLSALLALDLGVELLRTRSAWYRETAATRG